MHKSEIYPEVLARVRQRRGSVAVFDEIVPERTAHIVVDLQNGFMEPGQVAEMAVARAVVPNVNKISAALRDAGGTVVFLQHTFDEVGVATWPVFFNHFCRPERRQGMIDTFSPGSFGHALHADVDIQPGDVKMQKRRFSAFTQDSSNLHAFLQGRGIDTLIITGTATQVCCESTARDAMMLNYKVFFITDGNATLTDDEHNATLSAMAYTFCDVRDTRGTLALIEAAKRTE